MNLSQQNTSPSSTGIGTVLVASVLILSGCTESQTVTENADEPSSRFEITTMGLTFEAPDSIASGWITFAFVNRSAMTHFALVERMPEGVGIAEQQREVAPVFQEGMDLLQAGSFDDAMAAFGALPPWFAEVEFLGGPGLVGPGRSSETTVRLAPGRYLVECYVKTGGIFHSYNPDSTQYGMVHEFTVTSDTLTSRAPAPTLTVELSSSDGIAVTGEATPGDHTIAVHFKDQMTHENFVGHDLHLARLGDDTDLESLENWMNWSVPGGLETPAPVEFVGGVNEMPAGSTAYLHVSLEPCRYAWIYEVPASEDNGVLRVLTVAPAS
ncbi:MAG: hypothetical protein R3178_06065 [Rhodothermales bacterium]|nr:hypothetical protein [Rhodothermales bacterium]